MRLDLSRVGQIALSTVDIDRAERFYEEALGLRKLFRFGALVFFDCAGLRLMIAQSDDAEAIVRASPLYFRCADIDCFFGHAKYDTAGFILCDGKCAFLTHSK